MSRPKLQIALDHNDLEQALADVFQVGDIVDIIEDEEEQNIFTY